MSLEYTLEQYSKRTNKEINEFIADLENMVTMPEATIWEGGPGIGKVFILKQILADKGCNVIYKNFTSLGLYGGNEHDVTEIFDEARRKSPCAIVFDEIDFYDIARADENSYSRKKLHRIVDETIRLKDKPVVVIFVGDRISDSMKSTYMKYLDNPKVVHIELNK